MRRRSIILSFNENEINGLKIHCPSCFFSFWKWNFSWQTLLVNCQRIVEIGFVYFYALFPHRYLLLNQNVLAASVPGPVQTHPTFLFPFILSFRTINSHFPKLSLEWPLITLFSHFHWLLVGTKMQQFVYHLSPLLKWILFSFFFHLLSSSTGTSRHFSSHRWVKSSPHTVLSCKILVC